MSATEHVWAGLASSELPHGSLVLVGLGLAADTVMPPESGVVVRHVPGGAVIALAEGARLADPVRPVVAVAGDGDLYGCGLGPLLHASRRNTGVTCIAVENGMAGPNLPSVGPGEFALRPLAMALAAGATFVAQGLSRSSTEGLIREAVQHPGFALVAIRDRYTPTEPPIVDADEDYDRHSLADALTQVLDPEQVITGLLYSNPERQSFEQVAVGLAPITSIVCTTEMDVWDRIVAEEGGEHS